MTKARTPARFLIRVLTLFSYIVSFSIVAVMVTARAFANVSTERTIYFMLFSAEEQGLIGSEVFVEEYYESGEYVSLVPRCPRRPSL